MCNESLLQVIVSLCVHYHASVPKGDWMFCYINQTLIGRLLDVALASEQVAPSSCIVAASLVPGITSALGPPRPALHLLASLPLELFYTWICLPLTSAMSAHLSGGNPV